MIKHKWLKIFTIILFYGNLFLFNVLYAADKNSPQPISNKTEQTDKTDPVTLTPTPDISFLGAQSADSDTPPGDSLLDKIIGTPTPNTLYLGMATFHFEPGSRDDRWNNELIAGSYHGYFAGTLINSFDDRAFAAGIERIWGTQQLSANVQNQVGYRVGLITGYDERLAPIAAKTPVLPFPQIFDNIVVNKHFGIQLSWCVVTASAGFMYQF